MTHIWLVRVSLCCTFVSDARDEKGTLSLLLPKKTHKPMSYLNIAIRTRVAA